MRGYRRQVAAALAWAFLVSCHSGPSDTPVISGTSGSPGDAGAANSVGGSVAATAGAGAASQAGAGTGAVDASGGSAGTGGASVGGVGGGGGGSSGGPPAALAPSGLLTELTVHPDRVGISDATPDFAWIVPAAGMNQLQSAYRVLVASSQASLDSDTGDLWDSKKTLSGASVNVSYAGKALAPSTTYYWKVQTWDSNDKASAWSAAQAFTMAASLGTYSTPAPPVDQTPIAPVTITQLGSGHSFIDFGRAAFGWLELTFDAPTAGAVVSVSLGEKANGQAVDLAPGGSIRAAKISVTVQQGQHTYRVQGPKDATNTSSPAIPLPAALGVVMPFRYAEVSNVPVALSKESVRQVALAYPFDETAASFSSSDLTLDKVWGLAAYSIKATTFADMYIDGDRERRPYEADAYIQQLGHYALDRDYALARKSHEYLMANPTWPTEWKFHSVMMAWADWMYTGNSESLAKNYAALKQSKTLESYVNTDGLLDTGALMDIVDWPEGERDGYVLTPVNTVVNSFWCYILGLMADLATAQGNASDATRYRTMAATATAALNSKLWSASTGLYVDGQTTTHSALHANMFPLAFGLVPADRQAKVAAFVQSRGMACSVYGAQYLLEALFRSGRADAALALLTATNDRSWKSMLDAGSTITMEAWAAKYKPNLDWNHAWAAAPANIVARYVLGVRPATPGFGKAVIAPQPGALAHIKGTVATIRGSVGVAFDASPLAMTVTIPANMTADLALPPTAQACAPLLDGMPAKVTMTDGQPWIAGVGSGEHTVRCP